VPKHSFRKDWEDMLVRFASRGAPMAAEDQLEQALHEVVDAESCRNYRLNQALFEQSVARNRSSTAREFSKSSSRC